MAIAHVSKNLPQDTGGQSGSPVLLFRALGRNTVVSFIVFGALLGVLWVVEQFTTLSLLHWENTAWCVGIPASIIGVAYILTIRDPQNYTGFYAGILMSALLGVQFFLQGQYDSTVLYFCVFIPLQAKSILQWRKPTNEDESNTPAFLNTKAMWLSIGVLVLLTAADYLLATYAFQHNNLGDNVAVKMLNGLLISSSVLANYWLIYKKTDAWLYWVLYSIAGIGLFTLLGNIFSIVLFIFFLVINGIAAITWIKESRKTATLKVERND